MFFWRGGKKNKENEIEEEEEEDEEKEDEEEEEFVCEKGKDLDECELEVIRRAVDASSQKVGKRKTQSPETKKMIEILENFLRKKKLICYGGIALNNILPEDDQFYEFDVEIPDYDFFSTQPERDAIELADIYVEQGFENVEAKAGQHLGTYKVFVNFTGMADITEFPESVFKVLQKEAIEKDGILYTPPNFLRMSIYNELSNIEGDTSRYEKIYKRLRLINKYYPISQINCDAIQYERNMEDPTNRDIIYRTLFDVFVQQEVVFMGGFAMKQFVKYMKKDVQKRLNLGQDDKTGNPDFDVIANHPERVMQALRDAFQNTTPPLVVKFVKHEPVGEVLQENWTILIGNDAVGFIYQSVNCKSYNVITMPSINNPGKQVSLKIASIDTMLMYYFIFLFIDQPYYDHNRIMCMANFLWEVQQQNRLSQKGILKRFPMKCYGHQLTLEEMKMEKAEIYHKYGKTDRTNPLFQKAFFKYKPTESTSEQSLKESYQPETKERHLVKKTITNQKRMNYVDTSSIYSLPHTFTSNKRKKRKNQTQKKYSLRHKREKKNKSDNIFSFLENEGLDPTSIYAKYNFRNRQTKRFPRDKKIIHNQYSKNQITSNKNYPFQSIFKNLGF